MISIITDSKSDLGADIATEFGLSIIPLTGTIRGDIYRNWVDIS